MISIESAERIAKSRYRFSISLLIVISVLFYFVINLIEENKNIRSECEKESKVRDSMNRAEIARIMHDLKDCELGNRISQESAIKAAQKDAEDYKKLYIKMLELKAQAQQKNIIR